jgi:hypothetical protein
VCCSLTRRVIAAHSASKEMTSWNFLRHHDWSMLLKRHNCLAYREELYTTFGQRVSSRRPSALAALSVGNPET